MNSKFLIVFVGNANLSFYKLGLECSIKEKYLPPKEHFQRI